MLYSGNSEQNSRHDMSKSTDTTMRGRAPRLACNVVPEALDARHVLQPRQEVEAHAVEQPRVAPPRRQAHVKLVQVVGALRRPRARLDLARLLEANEAVDHAGGLEGHVDGVGVPVAAEQPLHAMLTRSGAHSSSVTQAAAQVWSAALSVVETAGANAVERFQGSRTFGPQQTAATFKSASTHMRKEAAG